MDKLSKDTISNIIKLALVVLVLLVIFMFNRCSSDKRINKVKDMKVDIPSYVTEEQVTVDKFFDKTCETVKWEEYETEALLHAVDVKGKLKGGESFNVQFIERKDEDAPFVWWYMDIDGTKYMAYDFINYLLRYWE